MVPPVSPTDPHTDIARAVEAYRVSASVSELLDRLESVAHDTDPELLAAAVEPYRELPEVAGPIYEHIVRSRPTDARALVILANAYWLSGRGPDAVGELAARAIACDPLNRGAWHLWALTEGEPHARMVRWMQVSDRFPTDELARANLADNAASVADADRDPDALALAIRTYEWLLARATHAEQRQALEHALGALSQWRF